MEEGSSPQLLDLIPNERQWEQHMLMNSTARSGGGKSSSEEKKLELRLAPPGEENWSQIQKAKNKNGDESLLSLGFFKGSSSSSSSFLHHAPQPCSTRVVVELQHSGGVGGGGGGSASASPSSAAANTAVPNTSQKRTAPGPVVGWPPIRSFRKNLSSSTSNSSKPQPPPPESSGKVVVDAGKKHVDNNNNGKGGGLFVKINMDGVPIGRKVDLNAYHTYENLSSAVDHLFRGLLAAQRSEEEKAITGLLDGSGEYTLVYEDNEGDRMLVGDVPWQMFVSTVKRLRVLKSSELSAFTLGGGKQETRQ